MPAARTWRPPSAFSRHAELEAIIARINAGHHAPTRQTRLAAPERYLPRREDRQAKLAQEIQARADRKARIADAKAERLALWEAAHNDADPPVWPPEATDTSSILPDFQIPGPSAFNPSNDPYYRSYASDYGFINSENAIAPGPYNRQFDPHSAVQRIDTTPPYSHYLDKPRPGPNDRASNPYPINPIAAYQDPVKNWQLKECTECRGNNPRGCKNKSLHWAQGFF